MKWFSGKHVYRKMMKHPGSPGFISRGVAIGCFCAFFIPSPLQMPVAFLLAVVFRAARIMAMLFTWLNNPLTIAFLYPAQCYVGSHLIRHPLTYTAIKELLSTAFHEHSYRAFLALGSNLLASFLAGGLLFGTIAAVIGYSSSVYFIKRHRRRKESFRQRLAIRRNARRAKTLNSAELENIK